METGKRMPLKGNKVVRWQYLDMERGVRPKLCSSYLPEEEDKNNRSVERGDGWVERRSCFVFHLKRWQNIQKEMLIKGKYEIKH